MANFFVRPDTSHNTTRNGLTYETAWGGIAEINFGTVGAGNTLYFCGTFDLTTVAVYLSPNGTLGNEVIIRGDYAGSPGVINMSGTAYWNPTKSHVRYVNLTFNGKNIYFYNVNASTNVYDIKKSPTGYNISFEGCTLNSCPISIEGASNGGTTLYGKLSFINNVITSPASNGISWLCGSQNKRDICIMEGITISGNTISNCPNNGIQLRFQPAAQD